MNTNEVPLRREPVRPSRFASLSGDNGHQPGPSHFSLSMRDWMISAASTEPNEKMTKRTLSRKIVITGQSPLLPGSISTARSTCGRPLCACKGHPPKLHGLYYRWTRMAEGKRTTITLTQQEVHECQRRIQNYHHLKSQRPPWRRRPRRMCAGRQGPSTGWLGPQSFFNALFRRSVRPEARVASQQCWGHGAAL